MVGTDISAVKISRSGFMRPMWPNDYRQLESLGLPEIRVFYDATQLLVVLR